LSLWRGERREGLGHVRLGGEFQEWNRGEIRSAAVGMLLLGRQVWVGFVSLCVCLIILFKKEQKMSVLPVRASCAKVIWQYSVFCKIVVIKCYF